MDDDSETGGRIIDNILPCNYQTILLIIITIGATLGGISGTVAGAEGGGQTQIIEFEMTVLIVGFIASLLIGSGTVFLTFTMIPSGIGRAAITAVGVTVLALYGMWWVGHEVIIFDTIEQAQATSLTNVFGGGVGATLTLLVFEPQTGESV